MRFIDAHLHTDMIEDVQLQKLVMMGMEACVVPSPHMFVGSQTADGVLQLWERFLTLEVNTATTLGFEEYVSLSVPFFGVTKKDAETCLARLPDFLKHERAVAMGEIGLDCGTEFEEWLFREHLRIAAAHGLPVILHTPIRAGAPGAGDHAPRPRDHQGGRLPRGALRVRPRRRGDHGLPHEHGRHGRSVHLLGQDAAGGRPRATSSTTPTSATASSSTRSSAAWATTTSWCRGCSSP